MNISEAALTEFIELYKAEFDEDIPRDEAEIIARNLVMFYEDMMESGVMKPEPGEARQDSQSSSAPEQGVV